MEKISSLRRKIDKIDEEILNFLRKRVETCKSIGEIKREHQIPIRDLKREKERYTYITKRATELDLNPQKTKAVYQKIIALCINAQKVDSSPEKSS